jgi:hypothetical protein
MKQMKRSQEIAKKDENSKILKNPKNYFKIFPL